MGFGLGIRSTLEETDRLVRATRAGALAGLTALLVHSMFDFNLRIPSNGLLFAGLVALVIAPGVRRLGDGRFACRRRFAAPLVAVAVSTVFVAISTPWGTDRLRPDHEVLQMMASEGVLRRAALESDAVRALRRRPAFASGWVLLGWLRLPASHPEAMALSGRGVELDPQHVELRAATARVLARR